MATRVYYTSLKPLVVLFACFCLFGCLSGCSHTSSNEARKADEEGTKYQSTGVMSKSEHQRIMDIEQRLTPNGKLSEGEVDWLLSIGRRDGTEQQKAPRMQWVILALGSGNHDTIPASRRNAVFDFATQTIRYSGNNASAVRHACYILAQLGDKRAIPYLTPLLSSDNGDVSRAARQVIHALKKQS